MRNRIASRLLADTLVTVAVSRSLSISASLGRISPQHRADRAKKSTVAARRNRPSRQVPVRAIQQADPTPHLHNEVRMMNCVSIVSYVRESRSMRIVVLAAVLIISSIALQAADQRPAAAYACNWSMTYYLQPGNPELDGSSVTSQGSVTQSPDWYCLVESVWLRGQTKVCGFWGCNWHTKAGSGSDGQESYWSDSVSQDCRSGTHRYRTETGIGYRVLSGLIGVFPTNSYEEAREYSPVKPEFSCN